MKKHCIVLFSVLNLFLFLSCNNNNYLSPISVTGISIAEQEATLSMVEGTTHTIQAKVQPENATDKRLTYTSNNEEIASVNDKGLITAKAVGNTKITIKAANGITKEITVTVSAALVAVQRIVFDPAPPASPLPLSIGGNCRLHAKAQPENATDKKLTYTSNNESIASVDAEGLITAKAAGSAKITIKAANNISTEITVTVSTVHIAVTGISLSSDENSISLVNGDTRQINAHAIPENATDKNLTYTSDNEGIVSVDAEGLITAKTAGSAKITIKAADGISKTIDITVTAAPIRVTSIEFVEQPADPVVLVIGESYELKLRVMPEDARNKSLIIKSSDDGIAWPNGDRNLSIKAYGTIGDATVTITSADNSSVKKEVHFKIKPKPSIKIKTNPSVCESNGGEATFTIETLDGKLKYTPVVTGGGAKWLSVAGKDNSSESIDTVRLNVSENKTVWNRTAYIKFKGEDGNYIKGTDKKELEVKLTQKKNENPNVTIKWVYGITPPADDEKLEVEIQGSNPPEKCEIPYVFYWYETNHTKFFNTRKMHPTVSPDGGRSDSNQCWAKTSSNMLHWWFDQNESNIDKYIKKKGITEAGNAGLYKMYKPVYTRELPDNQENVKSSIANEFRTKCHNGTQGSFIRNGLQWYLFGLEKFADNPNYSPELFKDVFSKEDGKNPIETRGSYTKREFNEILKKALGPGSRKAVGLNLHGDANYAHAITLWGAAFDEEENVIAIYVVDNNFQPNRIFTYGIHYLHDIYAEPNENYPHLINYANNYYDKKKHVGEITTLDKGDAQWQAWLAAHP